MLIVWIIIFSLLGSLGAVFTAFIFLKTREKIQLVLIPSLISYASGTLLATALLGLIPHALDHSDASTVLLWVLIGIILFFLLEKLIILRHCHDKDCEIHHTKGILILIGDAFHNAVDGVIIAVSFMISIPIGIVTSLSVIAHEIPQEVGDFAILIHDGYPIRKSLILNTLSGITTVPAAIISYFMINIVHTILPYAMAISAASFLYIALTDLYPELHKSFCFWVEVRQFVIMLFGVGTIIFILQFH